MCLSRVYMRVDNFVALTAAFGFHLFPSTKLMLLQFSRFSMMIFPLDLVRVRFKVRVRFIFKAFILC